MEVHHNVSINKIAWLKIPNPGVIKNLFIPENRAELEELCCKLYSEKKQFDVIGHTSNILYYSTYNPENVVSTRKVNFYSVHDNVIECDCGVNVSKLSREMVEFGFEGFEGLIDLPGTIGAAIFGNAGCYDCSITSLLEYCELLRPDGTIVRLSKDDLELSKRSTVLKRKEVGGIILFAFLSKRKGDPTKLQAVADINRQRRRITQPGPAKNLGSDFASVGKVTLKYRILMLLCRVYYLLYYLKIHLTRRQITSFILKIVGHRELIPYLEWGWNRFIWKDDSAFVLFNAYKKLYLSFFQNDRLEIIEKK